MGDNNIILFPLLRLPKTAQQNTIQVMEPLHSLGFSTISKTAKALVKSSELQCTGVWIYFKRTGAFKMQFEESYETQYIALNFGLENINAEGDLFQDTPELRQQYGGERFDLERKQNYSIGKWICHFMSVLNYPFINITFVSEEIVNIDSIRHIFHQYRTYLLKCINQLTPDYMVKLIETITPVEQLALDTETRIPHQTLAKVNMKNFNYLKISRTHTMTLDDLLIINSVYLNVRCILEPKVINRFVKLWMKNSNLNAKSIFLSARHDKKTPGMILDGIHYEKQEYEPKKEVDLVSLGGIDLLYRELSSGYAIRREDGTEAIIYFRCLPGPPIFCRFHMFVSQ